MPEMLNLSQEYHLSKIKKFAFRGKIEEIDYIHSIVTIKVSSRRSKALLEAHFKKHGIVSVFYNIKLLGLFECWFPRYQMRK